MRDGRDTVFYDGECALCHATVRFFVRRDPGGLRFSFAPLGGDAFRRLIPAEEEAPRPDSVVVRTADGHVLVQSAAVAHLLRRLDGSWSAVGKGLSRVPSGLADGGYALIARLRRHLFGRPSDWCPVPEGPERERFSS